ncbi:putative transforming protein E6 [Rangifer tarandus papillomavirus 1]|uniref:Protein E6 n=1 Tax=Rangifer tarandus papillomavirus 1 TaxID=2773313 RepID=Q8BDR5_9PAPI|nr:putative transforming protein E6 [Rangifer tarandus papillomavirus 1]
MCADYYEPLQCIWCKATLGKVEAKRCLEKRIRPACRDMKSYAACTHCLENALYLERTLFPGKAIHPGHLQQPDPWITQHVIRCMYCGGQLSRDEKERHRLFFENFWLFRSQVRGRCYSCTRDGARPPYEKSAAFR